MVRRDTSLSPVEARHMPHTKILEMVVNTNVINVNKLATSRETVRGGQTTEVMLKEDHFTLEQEILH